MEQLKLTSKQIQILEDAFASYPDDFSGTSLYTNMKGIQEQIKSSLEQNPELTRILIFYISKVIIDDKNHHHFTMEKMEVGKD